MENVEFCNDTPFRLSSIPQRIIASYIFLLHLPHTHRIANLDIVYSQYLVMRVRNGIEERHRRCKSITGYGVWFCWRADRILFKGVGICSNSLALLRRKYGNIENYADCGCFIIADEYRPGSLCSSC